MTMTIDDLKLDDEFKRLCPALKTDELHQLRENIIRDGRFLDSIKHWGGVIVDGHNRYDVWFNGELPDGIAAPNLEAMGFANRDEALNWIILHQLGRRNLPPNEAAYLRGKLVQQKAAEKSAAPEKDANSSGKTDDPNLSQNGRNSRGRPANPRRRAAQQVAQATGVSTNTADREFDYAAAIDTIAALNSKAASDIKSGTLKVPKKDVVAIAKSGNIGGALNNLRKGLAWDHDDDEPEAPQPPPEPELTDALKRPVPPHLARAFESLPEYAGLIKRLGDIRSHVAKLFDQPGGECIDLQDFETQIKNAQSLLKFSRPHTECPDCRRKVKKTCGLCKGTGYIVRGTFNRLSDVQKQWLNSQ